VLRDVLSRYSSSVEIVSGPLDWDLVPATTPTHRSRRVRIVYATSRSQDRIGRMLDAPLLAALDEHPDVELTIWGPESGALARHPRVRMRPFVRDYDRFFKRFAREGFDIGLAPLPDDLFHRCKSNNKFREYAACGVAGIYSDTPVYNTCVTDGVTGLLVSEDRETWTSALRRLIEDAGLRRQIAARAREAARARHNEAVTDAEWMAPIAEMVRRAPGTRGGGVTVPGGTRSTWRAGLGTLAAALRHFWRLGAKGARVGRQHGAVDAARRARNHVMSFLQLAVWKARESWPRRRVVRREVVR
jgi:hypothetical protein